MADLIVYQNDRGFNIVFTVQAADGTGYNLTNYVATLKIWPPGNTAGTIVSGTCAITNANPGTATYTAGSAIFTTPGMYLGELELTQAGIAETTNPFTVEIKESA